MYVQQSGVTRKLWEASGIGEYDQTGNWAWQFYPPPYDFLAPADSVAIPAPILLTPRGMAGGCSCGGTCGKCSDPAPHVHSFSGVTSPGYPATGMGQDETTAAPATLVPAGLFSGGLDPSTWGIGEWSVVGVGAYLAISIFSDVGKAAGGVKKAVRKRKSTARRRAELESQLGGL